MSERSFDDHIAQALANMDSDVFRRAIQLAATLSHFERLHAHAATFKCIEEVRQATEDARMPSECFRQYYASDNEKLRPQTIHRP